MNSSFQKLEELVKEGFKLYPGDHFGAVRYNEREEPILEMDGVSYVGQYISRFQDKGKETVYGPITQFAARGGLAGMLDMLKRIRKFGISREYKNWGSLSYKKMAEILRNEGVEKLPKTGIMVEVRVLELPDGQTYQYVRPSIMHLDSYPRRESA